MSLAKIIIALNALVFVIMSWQSGSLLVPTPEVLLAWGAKDPVLFAQGEYWRVLTPIFVHIGFIHFFMNMWALHVLSQHVENILGRWAFLAIYLVSGVMGNVFSLVFSLAVSAGASSSVFGIMGAGYLMEFLAGRRLREATGYPPPRNVYTSLLIVNLGLGLMIPQIDNSAHLGGLVAGMLFTMGLLSCRRNSVLRVNRRAGAAIFMFIAALVAAGLHVATDSDLLLQRFMDCGEKSQALVGAYHCYNEALRLDPRSTRARLKRAVILIKAKEFDAAKDDILALAEDPANRPQLIELRDELAATGIIEIAAWIDSVLAQHVTL